MSRDPQRSWTGILVSASCGFPSTRLRRLRRHPRLRDLVRETSLSVQDLVMPLFVRPGRQLRRPIPSMPEQFQLSVDLVVAEAKELKSLGIPAVLLFGIPERKDAVGSDAYAEEGIVQQAVRALKDALGDTLCVMTDVCLCEYTDHGHCGVVTRRGEAFTVENDATLELLAQAAVSHARAGADVVAPSAMMDGMVSAIRRALDEEGFHDVPILSYAAKYASALYGPFRQAAESAPQFGDRRSYQMDPGNVEEALREVELDVQEGADIVMVKPALFYLDVIWRVKQRFPVPVAAYNVSGEYALIKAAAAAGWLEERSVALEALTAIRRAGADIVITYFAKQVARWLG
jgi:porphobilinogen synthase